MRMILVLGLCVVFVSCGSSDPWVGEWSGTASKISDPTEGGRCRLTVGRAGTGDLAARLILISDEGQEHETEYSDCEEVIDVLRCVDKRDDRRRSKIEFKKTGDNSASGTASKLRMNFNLAGGWEEKPRLTIELSRGRVPEEPSFIEQD